MNENRRRDTSAVGAVACVVQPEDVEAVLASRVVSISIDRRPDDLSWPELNWLYCLFKLESGQQSLLYGDSRRASGSSSATGDAGTPSDRNIRRGHLHAPGYATRPGPDRRYKASMLFGVPMSRVCIRVSESGELRRTTTRLRPSSLSRNACPIHHPGASEVLGGLADLPVAVFEGAEGDRSAVGGGGDDVGLGRLC